MDDLDRRLIEELKINARATVPTLAKLLGVARGTVQTRLDRLIASGTIRGFTVRLKDRMAQERIRGVVMIELSGRNIKALTASLRRLPGIAALHTTNGLWDLIGEIEVASLGEFNHVVTELRAMEGVAKSESHLFLGAA
ncbi:Lrp/AsnC family transcriptional regulator [Gellertiella hungarica]|uniref:DNA-binding Lrp family transcriptional regulator n=1 Tax=Gellertiella hungarica TaxID=1572859 RepID=A0A7W6NL76_9HYPH|nr:Lrp/AsnC family transcriptional regulator [Gellertiella hungarica]MBB4065047.1 DNA-binding Lrp family transcriptional regulator [Gellertiella hungarica]